MFLQVSVILSRGGMHGCSGGGAWLLMGGMHGCSWGACMVALGGCAWLLQGGMCGCSGGHVWLLGGSMHGCSQGVWVLAPGGACMVTLGGHAWFFNEIRSNERAVRILLECILVCFIILWIELKYSIELRLEFNVNLICLPNMTAHKVGISAEPLERRVCLYHAHKQHNCHRFSGKYNRKEEKTEQKVTN